MKSKLFKENSYYQGLIQNLYADSKGCFVSCMQFFYQYNQALVNFENYAPIFKFLYESELKNCSVLSEILIKMGGDNKYFSSMRKFVSGYAIDYSKSLDKMFLSDIELLELGVIMVKSAINTIDDNTVKEELQLVLLSKKSELKKLKENYFKNNLIQ